MTTNGAAPVAALVPERRWPMAVAVLATIVLQVITPHNGRLTFWWVYPILELGGARHGDRPRPRAHRPAHAARPSCHARVDAAAHDRHGRRARVLTLDIVDEAYSRDVEPPRCSVAGRRSG